MTVYWGACLASIVVAWMGLRTNRGRENVGLLIALSALPLLFVGAFRYDVGEDYLLAYVPYFEKVSSAQGNYDRMEPLFHLINWLVALLHGDYIWVFAISALMFIAFVYSQIFKDSPYPELSIFLLVAMGYYFVSFNAMRQMIGCAILLFSIRFIESRQLLRFMLCVAVASCFHVSCVVFAAMYWFGRIKIKPFVAFALSAALFVLKEGVAWILKEIISLTKYGIYFSSIFDTGEVAAVMLAINAILLLLASMCYQENPSYRIYYNLQLVALCVTIFSGSIALFLRLLWVFGLPSIIMIPMAVRQIPMEKSRKLVTATVVLLFFIYATYTVGIQNSNSVLPYQTVFSRWI